MKRNLTIVVALVILATAAACLWLKTPHGLVPFNSGQWKSGTERLRGRMVHELPGSSRLLGKDETQVLKLLGEPDFRSENKWAYKVDVGAKFFFSRWAYYLTITFDSNKVATIELHD